MKKLIKPLFLLLIWAITIPVFAQISGIVIDKETGNIIQYPTIRYKENKLSVSGNDRGAFNIQRYDNNTLIISAIGYTSLTIKISEKTPIYAEYKLTPTIKALSEIEVKSKKKTKYSRKNNPAVELMKRVIAAKQATNLKKYDYYKYNKYQKLTLAMNDIKLQDIENEMQQGHYWMFNQVEKSSYNDKFILPISLDETVSEHIYRKKTNTEKEIINGQRVVGLNKIFETGEILNTLLKDIFTNIDLYENQIRLLKHPFTSPIGKDAIDFYRFYIEDTVYLGKEKCYHLQFTPNNQQDFGFRGEIYIIADSTLHVKRCELTIPKKVELIL